MQKKKKKKSSQNFFRVTLQTSNFRAPFFAMKIMGQPHTNHVHSILTGKFDFFFFFKNGSLSMTALNHNKWTLLYIIQIKFPVHFGPFLFGLVIDRR